MQLSFSKDTTIDDIINDPKKYGAPTFEEFKHHKEQYQVRTQTVLDSIDNGSSMLRNHITGVRYEIFGIIVNRAVEAEKIANDHGYKKEDLEMEGHLQDEGGHKCRVLFKIKPSVDAMIRVQMQAK